jgi:hypothetical protein
MRLFKPPVPRKQWNSPIPDYDLLSTETCNLLFNQSKDFFEETVSESEELTKRSTRMLFLFIPAVAAVIAYFINNRDKFKQLNNFRLLIAACGCVVYCLYNLIVLIGPKNIHYKGNKPEQMMRKEIFQLGDINQVEKALYISEIETYQIKIEQMEFWNYERIDIYVEFIYSFLIMVGIGIALLILSI